MGVFADIRDELKPMAKSMKEVVEISGKIKESIIPMAKAMEGVEFRSTKMHKAFGHLININKKMLTAIRDNSTATIANSIAMSEQTKEAEKTTKSLLGLAQIIEVVKESNESFSRSMSKASSESKIWTTVSRMVSGSPFWKIQNKVRAVADAFSAYYSMQDKGIERQLKAAEASNKLFVAFRDIQTVKTRLDEAVGDASEFEELAKEIDFLDGQYQKFLQRLGGDEEAARAKAIEATTKMYGHQENKLKKIITQVEKRAELEERAQKIREKESFKLKIAGKTIFEAPKFARIRARAGMMKEGIEKRGVMRAAIKERVGQTRMGARTGGGAQHTAFKEKTARMKKELAAAGGFRNFISKFAKFAWSMIKRAVIYFIPLIIGIFVVFEIIKKIMKNGEMMQAVVDFISGVVENVMFIVEGVMDIFSAFFGEGTLGERFKLLLGGVGKIFGGLFGILLEILTLGLKLLLGLLIGVVTTAIELLVATLAGILWVIAHPVKAVKMLWGAIGPMLYNMFIAPLGGWWDRTQAWFIGLWNTITGIFTGLADAFGGIGETFSDMKFWQHGGIHTGGMAVVGERGPELVSMPAGTRVYSNADSKKMIGGNTNVTVNVQGRMGASDSELRDMAQKIGRMISREVNRTTSSSVRI